ncbi:hypothetical protein HOY82DRAFT_671261, partial [Tuber indicum]
MSFRRATTVYDTCDATLFKLSRLRVPRYKHIDSFTTLVCDGLDPQVPPNHRTGGCFLGLIILNSLWVLLGGVHKDPDSSCQWDKFAGFTGAGISRYPMSLWNSFGMGI